MDTSNLASGCKEKSIAGARAEESEAEEKLLRRMPESILQESFQEIERCEGRLTTLREETASNLIKSVLG